MGNSRNARRDRLYGKKRQARRDARASVSKTPSTAAALFSSTLFSEQREGRRDSKADVFSVRHVIQKESEKKGGNE